MEHPKVFVIFDPNQIYPEYLIQYRWGQERIMRKSGKNLYIYMSTSKTVLLDVLFEHMISFQFLLLFFYYLQLQGFPDFFS